MDIKGKIKTIIFKVFGLRFVGPENKTDKNLWNNDFINNLILKTLGIKIVRGYAQCGEDLILESLMPGKKDGFFVDIGANHPIRASNTYLFYKKGWKGISVEPNPSQKWLFKLFRGKDTNLNIGIGKEKFEINFYAFKINTLGTFDKKVADDYQKMGYKLSKIIKVPVLPLKDILEKYADNKEIDFLSVDVEGFDMEVLKSNDWKKFRPHYVILETVDFATGSSDKKTNNIFDPYMKDVGYITKAKTEVNTIYERTN